jgi:hypothetical protein
MAKPIGPWPGCPKCGRNEIEVFDGWKCTACGYELPEWMRAEFPERDKNAEREAREQRERALHPPAVSPLEMMGGRREAIEKILALHKVGT